MYKVGEIVSVEFTESMERTLMIVSGTTYNLKFYELKPMDYDS